ncbi:hemicentin-1-like isoform X4 [Gadus macrocephalus]|uniref:hemicentin-1-like isoform X4 n=1 Tax=Gadus macrocephalus TaxID=80720 RepID=UPI0028CB7D5F|nr:hemicentin-1-like isoform X4 [Gadus macrocephalus]
MRMNPWTVSVLLLLAGPLGADPDWHVEYPDSFCVVEGSTATIPCSFTHPLVDVKKGVVILQVKRLFWCPGPLPCHWSTANVYDSGNVRANSRFMYLGDLVGNCTLKIIKTVKQDAATYHFRFGTNAGGYTGREGVTVTVTNGEDVKVRSSVTDHVVKEGGLVTLTCTSACSFHQLDVHWYRDGHALPETSPNLHLSGLTDEDTGYYTCSLDSSGQETSEPWSLLVVNDEGPLGAGPDWHVEYPDSFCVVEGSTATIPCIFTHPLVDVKKGGAILQVKRVAWCPDSLICHQSTTNVYDSGNVRADSRFLYLGDLVGNCTLKIIKTVKQDAKRYYFRFETKADGYTGREGVTVTVTNGEDVKVRSSVTDNVVKEGGQVTLTCISACSFHQLDVHWYRNGHALSERGPALHLSGLTNEDTGYYTCSLDSSGQKTSAPWSLLVLEDEGPLGADPGWRVEYPDSFCVVEGSTATIPCSFTHPAGLQVNRVVWCANLEFCWHPVSNGYNSSNVRADSRFLYLGDLVRNCTLKIIKTVKRDAATYLLRFETDGGGHTGPKGVRVTVTDGEDVKVRSSVTDHVVKEGGQVTLTCTSACSFHQLDVHWYRNGHALSEKGPALHLSSLTNDNAGDYTCSLDSSGQKTSVPWCLLVGEYEDGEDVKVRSSVTDHVVKEGGQVTLTCTSACSFHQLDVHWYRNGHTLSETGPALHLSCLTNDDTGNYTCSLDSSGRNTSAPWSLLVLVDEGFHRSVHLKVAVVKGVVLAVLLLLLAGVVFAKWCSNKTNQM